ncbi:MULTISPECIES: hypothetical protein [unclassified Rhodococcus (in: high G+C Gram-positive bacteria)]|uniref:hypothetical protein n=1 Tax=unclassified Rhodococcus (in: high G+C Gram-positive bacteria) TaxID=192944 RepID=UPI001141DC4E|nr:MULTISPECIES: hypothetical protein [unclassified Rhodococcus (in: high G+C Gram-positive bacteria)]NDK72758.1 hypothetical protein [Rhodococcus qingshengii]TQC40399.1 hypothetical protein EEB16_01295 [Rhodococcus sp. WS7]
MTRSPVAEALRVIVALKAAPGALTASELASRTKLPLPVVLDALAASEAAELVARVPDSRRGFASRWRTTESVWL